MLGCAAVRPKSSTNVGCHLRDQPQQLRHSRRWPEAIVRIEIGDGQLATAGMDHMP